jgi:hypothetical protein
VVTASVFPSALRPTSSTKSPWYEARATDAAPSAARAQERYYSSYGKPAPLIVTQPPAPSTTPWPPIALAIAAALSIAAASATTLRRLRIRRRAAQITS